MRRRIEPWALAIPELRRGYSAEEGNSTAEGAWHPNPMPGRTLRIIAGCVLALLVFGGLFIARKGKTASERSTISAQEFPAIMAQAEKGSAQAERTIGDAYARGEGVKQDYRQAAKWYQRAAAQGDAQAQSALGELHEAGQGVSHDDAQAAMWYRRAAEQGLAVAQYNLAALYAVGKGVPLDNAQALKWYVQAANQGDSLAQFNVGMRYFEGHAIPPDPILAYKWLTLASEQNVFDAERGLKTLKARMSGAQLDQARELIREFHRQASKPHQYGQPVQ